MIYVQNHNGTSITFILHCLNILILNINVNYKCKLFIISIVYKNNYNNNNTRFYKMFSTYLSLVRDVYTNTGL